MLKSLTVIMGPRWSRAAEGGRPLWGGEPSRARPFAQKIPKSAGLLHQGRLASDKVVLPMPIDRDEFRQTLARWASGVSVVTAREGDRLVGMTVSAFCSVSLSPPLILICASHDSETCAVIQSTQQFAVNVLAEHQHELSQRFSNPNLEGHRFEDLPYDFGQMQLPLLAETSAALECQVTTSHVAGDHRIFIAEVRHTTHSDRAPLLFLKTNYGKFVPDVQRRR